MKRHLKLKTLIEKLEKARAEFVQEHGVEPTIWEFDKYVGLELTSRVRKVCPDVNLRRASRKFMNFGFNPMGNKSDVY